uniref:Uncharacterized protein n=1 Tax=Macrostomum lignano TaxID=282301 RepID=A0A1I8FD17_9PLAT
AALLLVQLEASRSYSERGAPLGKSPWIAQAAGRFRATQPVLLPAAFGEVSLRLHHTTCRHRRRFLCQRGTPIDEFESSGLGEPPRRRRKFVLNRAAASAATRLCDHAKFPVIALRPTATEGLARPGAASPSTSLPPSRRPRLPRRQSPSSQAPLMVDFELPNDSQNSPAKCSRRHLRRPTKILGARFECT